MFLILISVFSVGAALLLFLPIVPHVVVVVGLVCINDPWSYAVEPLMPDRSKVRNQTSGTRGFTPCAGGRGSLLGRVCSSDAPVQANQVSGCQGPGITFELFPRPRQTFGQLSDPFICADYSLRRACAADLGFVLIGLRVTCCSPSASPHLRWPEIVASIVESDTGTSRIYGG